MTIYKVTLRDSSEVDSYYFTDSKEKAITMQQKSNVYNGVQDEVEWFNYPVTRAGFLEALNDLAIHPERD